MKLRILLALVANCLVLSSAATAPAAQPAPLGGKLLLFAAASTTDAVDEIRLEFERLHPGVTVRTSFAASSALAQQIKAGAAADVFLSASSQWADAVEKTNPVARRRDLLGNTLVVVVPADSKLKIDTPARLTETSVRRLAVADTKAVPAGIYARQALEKLGLWRKLEGRLVDAADVRQALKFVEAGAADAGIVYSTDAATEKLVRVVLSLDEKLSEPIRYPLVLLRHANQNTAAATAFYEFLDSPAARAVFERHGFRVLADAERPQPPEAAPCGR
jgi:molybdate transport system substrate-binding protein